MPEAKSDKDKLVETLEEIGVPFEVSEDGEYSDVTIEASASDKYVNVTFKNGQYKFSN